MGSTSFLVLAVFISASFAANNWEGSYVANQRGCDTLNCCCPDGPFTVGNDPKKLTFTVRGSGAKCSGLLTFNANFDTSKNYKYQGPYSVALQTTGANAQQPTEGRVIKTRAGINIINTRSLACSFSALATTFTMKKSFWEGKYEVDKSCDEKSCCCPTGHASVSTSIGSDKKLTISGTGSSGCNGKFELNFEAGATGSLEKDTVTGTISLKDAKVPPQSVTIFRTAMGVHVANNVSPRCNFVLFETSALSMGVSVIALFLSALFFMQALFNYRSYTYIQTHRNSIYII
eukprot:TRINITY_DN4846_c0_g1_i1.p1 TRINITY_DN4846_c0_g1~~TRINITY_DN4846_c0_g1_i1.p1  ORF type:complete len:289 (-),score=60.27 TRINITY_DN4846_c0_g1_i1:133-999(-)